MSTPLPGAAPTAYDAVEYPDQWYPQTHPDRLATIATLHGMTPPPPDQCRVLELGCGAGWNLLHMAAGLPGSQFVGVDLAPLPIQRAQAYADELGLMNTTFRAVDLADVDEAFGTFDYIIAHGVYSWVPAAVRDRLMAISKALLNPRGVAYISYATYPGRYLTRVMREMMQYYVHRFDNPAEKARHARALLGFLREAQPGEGSYSRLLDDEMKRISRFPDQFFYHDDLSDVNEPCYFHEFAAHAATHGLQYLSEANFHETKEHQLSPKVVGVWESISENIVEYEQYRDFMAFRRFRQTLLCHEEVEVLRRLPLENMERFYIGVPAQAVPPAESGDGATGDGAAGDGAAGDGRASTRYEGLPESFVDAHSPLVRAALDHLGAQWPRVVAFDDLVETARRRAAEQQPDRDALREQDRAELGHLLLELYGIRFLVLTVRRLPICAEVSARPEASPLARWQARRQPYANSLIGINVRLDAQEQAILPLLDGTRDRAALLRELAARRDTLDLPDDALEERLDAVLHCFALEALLVA